MPKAKQQGGKKEAIAVEGRVTESLRNATFRVKLANGHEVLAYLSGKIKKNYIRVLLGDRVEPQFPLPDPDILTREHLAVPLAELDSDFCHPTTHEALGTIANRLRSDMLRAHKDVSQRLSVILSDAGQAN